VTRRAFVFRLGAATCLLIALSTARCGSDFHFQDVTPHAAAPLAATYDILATYPTLAFPEFPATGLTLDLTLEIDANSPDPSTGALTGKVTIHDASVAGIPRSFSPATPLPVQGRLAGGEIDLMPFGPITVGATLLSPDLLGALSTDGRRIDGAAQLGNLPEMGTWLGVKQRRYLVAATDFSLQGTASVVTVRFDTRFMVDRDVELISGDPVAAASRGQAFIVNRLSFDNVQILDPAGGFTVARQFSTGNGSNPHDALSPDGRRIYVPRYEAPFNDLLIADASTGATLGTIPLGSLATNSSGTPRPDRLVAANGLVLVTLENIDATFSEYGPGILAFVDPASDTVVKSIVLAGQNPFGPPSINPDDGDVYLAEAGIFQGILPMALTGGIEVIDPISLTTRGILVDDDDLGGNVTGVAIASGSIGYAVVVTSAGRNDVVAFDPSTGAIGRTLLSTSALIPEIRYDGDGYLLVAEHDLSSPRLRVIDAATGTEVTRIALSLPPVSVAILTRSLLVTP
jgi:DNA-binding beta-propeller fold protein YncE